MPDANPSGTAEPRALIVRHPRSGWEVVALHGLPLLLLGLGGVALRFAPLERIPLPSCRWRLWTGWSCPLCGYTRALQDILQGEFAAALAQCPGSLVVFTGLAAAVAWNLTGVATRRLIYLAPHAPTTQRATRIGALLLLLAFLANWVYRIAFGLH